jgi:hypothetical protein
MPRIGEPKATSRMNNRWLTRLRRIRDILYWLAKVRAERL